MAYQLTDLLLTCNEEKLEFFISQIDSYVNFTSDKELKDLMARYKRTESERDKINLVQAIERDIRYLGSSDAAYAYRKMFTKEEPAGVSMLEIIEDVAEKLKVSKPYGLNVEEYLVDLATEYTSKKFREMSRKEAEKFFSGLGLGGAAAELLFNNIKKSPEKAVKLMGDAMGKGKSYEAMSVLFAGLLTSFIGEGAAGTFIAAVLPRLITPAVAIGAIWTGYSLQSPALRKTVPIVISLGLIAIENKKDS